ncbi:MAG: phage portal protein [Planctomycetaceae bacterium]
MFRQVKQFFTEQRSVVENPRSSAFDIFASIFGGDGSTGQLPVTAKSTLGYPPVCKAVNMIADDIAKLPINVYRRIGEDRVKAPEHRAHQLINLNGSPNEEDTAFDFWFDVMVDALLMGEGKGLAWIQRKGPNPIGLYRLVASDWRPIRSGGKRYWANYGSPPIVIPDSDMIVIRGICTDGLTPDDPIKLFADTLRVGISNQRYASSFFSNGAHVGGVLMAPPGASEPAIANVEKAVTKKQDPANWFKTLVLRDGFRWQTTTVDPKEASVVEIDESTTRHVARIYKLPPSKLGLSDTVSYNSLEHENKQYYDSTLTPWARRIQGQCNKKLLTPSEQRSGELFIEHHIDALQWADSQSRATIGTQGIQAGWLEINEVRKWHNLPALTPAQLAAIANRKQSKPAEDTDEQ